MPWENSDSETLRQMIRHECEVTNDRLSYLLTLQGLLFASLGFAWGNARSLILLLSVVGILTSVSILYMLRLAQQAIAGLIKTWDLNRSQNYDGPDVIGIRPRQAVHRWFSPSFILPMIFIIAWTIVPLLK